FRLAEACAGAGVRRVAIITGPDDEVTATERAEGFRDGLAAGGVEVSSDLVINAPFSRDGGFEATQALQDRLDGLELVAAMSDAMAVGAIAALRGMRWEGPEVIAVSGFARVPVLGVLLPGFRTVRIPLERFGEAALVLALEPETSGQPRHLTLGTSPIFRGEKLLRTQSALESDETSRTGVPELLDRDAT